METDANREQLLMLMKCKGRKCRQAKAAQIMHPVGESTVPSTDVGWLLDQLKLEFRDIEMLVKPFRSKGEKKAYPQLLIEHSYIKIVEIIWKTHYTYIYPAH